MKKFISISAAALLAVCAGGQLAMAQEPPLENNDSQEQQGQAQAKPNAPAQVQSVRAVVQDKNAPIQIDIAPKVKLEENGAKLMLWIACQTRIYPARR